MAHKIGLKVAAYFIIGLPGETRSEVGETIKYAKELAKCGVDEVAFGLFIPLPGTPLWEIAKSKHQEMDFLDLLAVGDMNKAVSWNDDIDAEELNALRLRAYFAFHITKMIYNPFSVVKSLVNILRNNEETKTERTILQFNGYPGVSGFHLIQIPRRETDGRGHRNFLRHKFFLGLVVPI